MFLSERIDARRCEALGLVNRVVPDAKLQNEAFGIARNLANGPASGYASIKDNLDLALSADFLTSLDQEAEKMVVAAGTEQHAEAVRAFIEKRVPSYSRPPNASKEAT
jgi:2-(1,2-epoxy-1,2-dihydrophenyl)acetyl-CoA isomerase